MTKSNPADARAVANRMLALGHEQAVELTPMKLLKLTYIAHGWSLGLTGEPLIRQMVYAWPYGPVIPDVYHAFKNYADKPIETPAAKIIKGTKWEAYDAEFTAQQSTVIERTFTLYRSFTGIQLSTITHTEGTPWAMVTKNLPPEKIRDIPIPDSLIEEHYRELASKK